ncbi:MAG TPA: hypothetical protein VKM55_01700 [Candidatus Lokiarchaeia archaeon]|nr:hypothetical protein [Candidatus Lokiarchaeia archaeon]
MIDINFYDLVTKEFLVPSFSLQSTFDQGCPDDERAHARLYTPGAKIEILEQSDY